MSGRGWASVHLVLLILWALAVPAAFVFGWWQSLPFIAFASIYANCATHWSAWQAARAERETQSQNQ